MPDRVQAMCAHFFARLLVTGDGDPLQKTIIFCASDHHADLVTNLLNNLYRQWCRANGQKRVRTYAFKCMASSNGQALIPDFRALSAVGGAGADFGAIAGGAGGGGRSGRGLGSATGIL